MRLLVTADLHYNHGRSTALADEIIDQMNQTGGDALMVVGDTAAYDGDALERCLERFTINGPKLFVAGNHELWTRGPNSYALFHEFLPKRVREMRWHWLQSDPFVDRAAGFAIVGSVGWYDYGFAVPELGIPKRFYERGVSPGATMRLSGFDSLHPEGDDVSVHARQVVARWNDAKFVKLHRSDETFLAELLDQLESQLTELREAERIVVGVHHVPFADLLPPRHGEQWDFARAYLGSPKIGELLKRFDNVRHVLCGHSHYGVEARIDHIDTVNLGSGYRQKRFKVLEM